MNEQKRVSVICYRCGNVLGLAISRDEATEKNRVHAAECEVLNGWA